MEVFKGLLYKNPGGVLPRFLYVGVPLGDREPHPMVPIAVICCHTNMECTVTPAVIPPSAAFFLQVFTENLF